MTFVSPNSQFGTSISILQDINIKQKTFLSSFAVHNLGSFLQGLSQLSLELVQALGSDGIFQ